MIFVNHISFISRYVYHPTDHYCSFIVNIRPLGTDSVFEVIWKPDWISNFRKVMQANRKYSHGVILWNKPFDEKLWSEMIDKCLIIISCFSYFILYFQYRYLFEHPDIPTMRPAENVGLQVRYLIERAFDHTMTAYRLMILSVFMKTSLIMVLDKSKHSLFTQL